MLNFGVIKLMFHSIRRRWGRILINISILVVLMVSISFALSVGTIGNNAFNVEYDKRICREGYYFELQTDINNFDKMYEYVNGNLGDYAKPEFFDSSRLVFKANITVSGINIIHEEDLDIYVANTSVPNVVDVTDYKNNFVEKSQPYDAQATNKFWLGFGSYRQLTQYKLFIPVGEEIEFKNGTKMIFAGVQDSTGDIAVSKATAKANGFYINVDPVVYYPPALGSYNAHTESIVAIRLEMQELGIIKTEEIFNTNYYDSEVETLNYYGGIGIAVAIVMTLLVCLSLSNSIILSINENSKFHAILSTVGIKDSTRMIMIAIEVVSMLLISLAITALLVTALMPVYLSVLDIMFVTSLSKVGYYTLTFSMPIIATTLIGVGIFAVTLAMVYFHMSVKNAKGVLEAIKNE